MARFSTNLKPRVEWTTETCYRWSECVHNENNAAENWKKKYGGKLDQYDMLYKYIPGMSRCIAGIDTNDGLEFISKGDLPPITHRLTKSQEDPQLSAKCYINRPKSGKQKVGYGELGIMSDYIDPSRAADTIYENDYCIRMEEFQPHIRGINMSKKSVNGPWRNMSTGTMEVIPTKWQYPPGTKQPEGLLVRSELRKLRLEQEARRRAVEQQASKSSKTSQLPAAEILKKNLMQQQDCRAECRTPKGGELDGREVNNKVIIQRRVYRERRPAQSRTWAPVCNPAPKGWYKENTNPPKVYRAPDEQSICNTPQTRLNVLKRRIDERMAILNKS